MANEMGGILKQLESRKALGKRSTPSEIFRNLCREHPIEIHELFVAVWGIKRVLLHILKQSNLPIYENYRGISLIDADANVLALLLHGRFFAKSDRRTPLGRLSAWQELRWY